MFLFLFASAMATTRLLAVLSMGRLISSTITDNRSVFILKKVFVPLQPVSALCEITTFYDLKICSVQIQEWLSPIRGRGGLRGNVSPAPSFVRDDGLITSDTDVV